MTAAVLSLGEGVKAGDRVPALWSAVVVAVIVWFRAFLRGSVVRPAGDDESYVLRYNLLLAIVPPGDVNWPSLGLTAWKQLLCLEDCSGTPLAGDEA